MRSLTGTSQGFDKSAKVTLQNNYFEERLPMSASALKYDGNIIIIKSTRSLKLRWYEEAAGRWIKLEIS